MQNGSRWNEKLLLILLLVTPFLFAQEVHYANQVTVAWDSVSPPGTVSYQVFVATYPVVDPQNPGAHDLQVETEATEATVTFPAEGKYAIGVRTKKLIDGEILYSEINWSFENGESTPNPFIVGHYIPPDAVLNLRLKED